MSTQTLSSIAIGVVEQCHQAGRDLDDACKAGVDRAEQAERVKGDIERLAGTVAQREA